MTSTSGQTIRHANFTDQRLFTTPLMAIWRGKMVSILAIGNQEGHSPAYLLVDSLGQTQIVSLTDVTVFTPTSIEQAQTLLNTAQEGATTR